MYLTLPWKGVVFHHLHQAYPKMAFPNEAFQMGIQEGPASTTGVYSLNIQLQGLHQLLMWQAMQPLHIEVKNIRGSYSFVETSKQIYSLW